MAFGDHWPSSAANSNRPRPDIVRLTENCLLLMRLSATSGISWKAANSHCLLITNLSRLPLVRSRMPGPHDSSISSQRYRNLLLTSDTWQARTMWSQMLFPGQPFRPLVGASISRPWLPPNSQTQSVWLPAVQQSLAFNLKIFRLDPITQPCCVMCLWVDHVPLYLSLSAVAFSQPSWPQPPRHTGNPQAGGPQVCLAWPRSPDRRMGQDMYCLPTSQSQSSSSYPII